VLAQRDDRSIQRIMSQIQVQGQPRPAPLVQGAFISCRISRPKEKTTLPMQQRRARAYVEDQLGIPVLEVFIDGKSGLVERKDYERMMQRALLGLCSHVVLYDFDRFGRERIKMMTDFDRLERRGIEVHDCTSGRITHESAGQKAVQANQEVRDISRRTLDGLLDRAQNEEEYNMPRRAPTGYRRTIEPGKPEKDSTFAPLITKLFQKFDAGATEGELARWWTAETGQRKRHTAIENLLRNEYYAGIDVYNKRSRSKVHGRYVKDKTEWITRTHDLPLIDMETFERVQARLAANRGRGQRRAAALRYALRGLACCAQCGYRLHGVRHRKDGGETLSCPVCHHGRSYRRVELLLQQAIRSLPLDRYDSRTAAHPRGTVERVQELTAKIEKVRVRRARIIIKREEGEYQEADYRPAMAETDRELADLKRERVQAVEDVEQSATIEGTWAFLHSLPNWRDLLDLDQTPTDRNTLYRHCFKQIVLDFTANTLAIEWMPALVRLVGRTSDTLNL